MFFQETLLSRATDTYPSDLKDIKNSEQIQYIVTASTLIIRTITKTHLFKYTEHFTTKKGKFPDKKF